MLLFLTFGDDADLFNAVNLTFAEADNALCANATFELDKEQKMSEAELAKYNAYKVPFQPDPQFTALARTVLDEIGFENADQEPLEDDTVAMVMLLGGFTPDLEEETWYLIETVEEGKEPALESEKLAKMNVGTVVAMPGTAQFFAVFARVLSAAQVQINDQYEAPVAGLKVSLNQVEE